ncbi:MAG TPA: TlpA disulfide reductase family protein [Pyrinomonadaceae bacterium]|nr:TlpA disulfide reductase family protein [Pyrinomonadaceae bacterium]
MRKLTAMLVLILNHSFVAAQANQNVLLTAKTEPPVLLDRDSVTPGMTESEYRKLFAPLAKYSDFIPIKRKPKKLSAAAKFGLNLVVNHKNIGWILDGSEARGYTLYADINGDGDLTNDAQLKLRKTDGKYSYKFREVLTETVGNRKQKYPLDLKIEISETKAEKKLGLKISDVTLRRGTLDVAGRQIAFGLRGTQGIYNGEFDNLYFDLNGDGRLDTETKYSEEAYKIPEKYVNIGDKTYEFSVDRYGDSLTLKPLAEKMPARASLKAGSAAPDFSFKDLKGTERRLSDYRGKIVLVDIWGAWCLFCVKEAPALSATYKKLKDKGFEIVSVNQGDTIEKIQKFIGEHEMSWTHSQADEAFLRLYRVDEYPTYFLLDKEGKIVSNTMRPGEEMYKKIEQMLGI